MTSQPRAMWPTGVCSLRASESTRTRTTVLATDSVSPNTTDAVSGHPNIRATPAPSAVAAAMPTSAPGMATRRTASSSSRWNCSPTPNMIRITPTSASCSAMAAFAVKAGRMRSDEHAGDQVADDGGEAEPLREVAEDERRAEASGKHQDQVGAVHDGDRTT